MASRDFSSHKTTLQKRLAELNERIEHVEDKLEDTPDPKWDENAIEHAEDEVLEELGLSGQNEIRAIKAALARLDAGTYGICTKCEEDISDERLEVLPHTPFCKRCARAI